MSERLLRGAVALVQDAPRGTVELIAVDTLRREQLVFRLQFPVRQLAANLAHELGPLDRLVLDQCQVRIAVHVQKRPELPGLGLCERNSRNGDFDLRVQCPKLLQSLFRPALRRVDVQAAGENLRFPRALLGLCHSVRPVAECFDQRFQPGFLGVQREAFSHEVDPFTDVLRVVRGIERVLRQDFEPAIGNGLLGPGADESEPRQPALVALGSTEIVLEQRVAPSARTVEDALLAFDFALCRLRRVARVACRGSDSQKLVERVAGRRFRQHPGLGFSVLEQRQVHVEVVGDRLDNAGRQRLVLRAQACDLLIRLVEKLADAWPNGLLRSAEVRPPVRFQR